MNAFVYKDANALALGLAEKITEYIAARLATQDRFTIALSGGNTPKQLHLLLASEPFRSRIDWKKMHIFWGDERAVPFTDDRNNAKMAFDTLLDRVPVPRAQIHVMRTDISPEASAKEYETILRQYFGGPAGGYPEKSFDLVLLGMGDDGHTLSLFPGLPVVHEEKVWVTSFWLAAQNMARITLTKKIANLADRVIFMISGAGKAHALHEVLNGAPNPDLYPSQEIKPVHGELDFFVDEAAYARVTG